MLLPRSAIEHMLRGFLRSGRREAQFLHHAVSKKKRDRMVERFQADGARVKLFRCLAEGGGREVKRNPDDHGPLKTVAYITEFSKRILDHLGLSPPQAQKPPPIRPGGSPAKGIVSSVDLSNEEPLPWMKTPIGFRRLRES